MGEGVRTILYNELLRDYFHWTLDLKGIDGFPIYNKISSAACFDLIHYFKKKLPNWDFFLANL